MLASSRKNLSDTILWLSRRVVFARLKTSLYAVSVWAVFWLCHFVHKRLGLALLKINKKDLRAKAVVIV